MTNLLLLALAAIATLATWTTLRWRAAEARVARLEEEGRRKQGFMDAVAHELRTPLTSIIGYLDILGDELAGPLTVGQQDCVQASRRGAQRLRNLVDDLLDFARIQAGTLELDAEAVDVGALLREEVASLEPQARAAGVAVELALPDAAVLAMVDRRRVGQVALNLITNALKFSRRSGVVTVSLQATGGRVDVQVQDRGIGIAQDDLGQLFQRYYQVDRRRMGTGLGLAISKAIVEAHGGTIGVISALGSGSTFFFQLPAAREAASPEGELAVGCQR